MKQHPRTILAIIWVISISGCAWFSPKKTVSSASSPFVQSGKIFDEEKLKAGGKVLIVPFRAGPGVEATEVLDKLSLRIVKALSDTFAQTQPLFEVVSSAETNEADYIIDGHITALTRSSKYKRLFLGKANKYLEVEGRMTDRRTGEIVAVFTEDRNNRSKEEDFNTLGTLIGQDIGRYILTAVN